MYMLYANDLSLSVSDDVTIVQYADDTQLLVSGKKRDVQRMVACMENALHRMYQWFCANGMMLNTAKTQMVVLGTPAMLRDLPLVSLHFCGTVVAESRAAKNLGVYVDRHLNYETHIDNVTRKCTGILIALTHARHVIPRVTLVLSVLRYCLSVYGSCGMTQLRRVQKLVNFCVRVVKGKRRFDHVSQSLEQLQWLTAEQLVRYQ